MAKKNSKVASKKHETISEVADVQVEEFVTSAEVQEEVLPPNDEMSDNFQEPAASASNDDSSDTPLPSDDNITTFDNTEQDIGEIPMTTINEAFHPETGSVAKQHQVYNALAKVLPPKAIQKIAEISIANAERSLAIKQREIENDMAAIKLLRSAIGVRTGAKRGPKPRDGQPVQAAAKKWPAGVYKHPSDPYKRPWNGVGRPPAWLIEARDRGEDIERFRS